MDALSRWVATFLLNSLWQVTLVAAAAALADLGWRRAPARYRHALWAMALAAAVVLPATSLLTREERSRTPVPLTLEVSAPASAFAPLPTAPLAQAGADQGRAGGARTAFLAGMHHRISVSPSVARAILVLYLLFLAVMLIRFGRAYLVTRATRGRAFAEPLPAHVVSTLERCQRAMARHRWPPSRIQSNRTSAPEVWWSREIHGPATVGVRRCAIILPLSLRDPDRVDDVTAALAHEAAHVARRDYLWNLLAELLSLPVAFHPLTLLMKRRLAETRELACDELAARVLDPSDYARSLVRLAHQMQRRAAAIRLDYTLSVFDANILEERVMRLLKPCASGRLAKICLLLSFFVISALCLAATRFSVGVTQAEPRPSSQVSTESKATSGQSLAPFVGVWRGKFKDKTFVLLNLRLENHHLAGTIGLGQINLDAAGNVSEVTEAAGDPVAIFDTNADAGKLYFKQKDGADTMSYEMQVDGAGQAQLKLLADGGPALQPVKLVKEPDPPLGASSVGVAQAEPRSSGLSQNDQPDEVLFEKGTNEIRDGRYDAGRLMLQTLINSYPDSEYLAKARLAIADSYNQESGVSNASVSGIVVDISGARVPNASVLLINRDSVARQEVSTDATGNFAFKNLSPGRYSLEVASKGMGRASRLFELKATGPAPFIPFVLEPGIMTESVVVTAKAPQGVSTNGAARVGPRRIRVGGNVEAAKLIDNPPPEYPEPARTAGIQGVVLLEAVISTEGVPMNVKVISSPSDYLSKAAMDAVSRWRYNATLLNGDPVEVLTTIAVAFRLEE